MTFITNPSKVREVRDSDGDFTIVDGMVVYPRAMLHVMPDCPSTIRSHIEWAVANGYLKAVAHVIDHELVWDKLSKPAD